MGRSLLITSRKRMSEVSGGGTAFSTAVVLSSLAKPPDGSSAVRRHCSLDVLVYHISLSIPPIRRLLHYGKQALSPRSGHEPSISKIYTFGSKAISGHFALVCCCSRSLRNFSHRVTWTVW